MDEDLIASGPADGSDPGGPPRADAGRRSRRVLLTAGTVAVGLLAGGGIAAALVSGGHGDGRQAHAARSPTPGLTFIPGRSHPPGEQIISGPVPPPSGPTAEQIAHGTWDNVSAAPIQVCPGALTAWDGRELLVVSVHASRCAYEGLVPPPVSAAAYEPSSNSWRKLPDPPRVLGSAMSAAWGNGQLFMTASNGKAIVWNSHADGWGTLPSLPSSPAMHPVSLAWDGSRLVAVGVGRNGDGSYVLDGDHWSALQPLPHRPGSTVAAVGAGLVDGTVYAVAAVAQVGADGTTYAGSPHLLRLDGLRWTELTRPEGLPYTNDQIAGYGERVFITGSGCPPGVPCPLAPPRILLVQPGQSSVTDATMTPLGFAQTDVTLAGRAVLSYNPGTTSTGPRIRPGATAVYDISHGRWLRAPSSVPVDDVAATAWTPAGFVVLGRPVEKCLCSLGGVILKPASK